MPADRNARRAIQRELGDLGAVQDYQASRRPGRRMTGWYASVQIDAADGCECLCCRARTNGKPLVWLGPDRVDACITARRAYEQHEHAAGGVTTTAAAA